MSVNGLGALLSLGAPVGISASDPTSPSTPQQPQTAAEQAKARADAAKAQQQAELDSIRKKGIYAYAQEKKFEALRERIEAEIRKEKGVDANGAAVSDTSAGGTDRTSFEAEVARRIQQAMEEAMTSEAKKAQNDGRAAMPMIIDISV